jgi:hypothetical protein
MAYKEASNIKWIIVFVIVEDWVIFCYHFLILYFYNWSQLKIVVIKCKYNEDIHFINIFDIDVDEDKEIWFEKYKKT